MPPDALNWAIRLPTSLLLIDPCLFSPVATIQPENSPERVPTPVPRQQFPCVGISAHLLIK